MENVSQQPQEEKLHEGNFDMILNLDADTNSLKDIKALVIDAIKIGKNPLSSWTPLTLADERTKLGKVFTNSKDDPKFMVKIKLITKEHFEFKAALKMPGDEIEKRVIYAMNSVSNEMMMSPVIKEAITDEKIQTKIKDLGFAGVKFIEPLLATINRVTTEKCVFYDYVKGDSLNNTEETDIIVRTIRDYLEDAGIMAYDLTRSAVLFDSNSKMLYLVDAEAYLKKSENE